MRFSDQRPASDAELEAAATGDGRVPWPRAARDGRRDVLGTAAGRAALRADHRRVLVLVIRQALVSAVVGVAGGLLLASWWSSSVEAVIVGISPRDPWSFTVAGLAALLVVTVASARPALRASRIDPALTLRAE
jgi:hypothetical protein